MGLFEDREAKVAVLLILAMIVIIFVMVIVMVNRSGAYRLNTARRISSLASYEYLTYIYSNKTIPSSNIFDKLKFYGITPDEGDVRLKSNGEVSIALKYGNKCYKKPFGSSTISIVKYSKNTCVVDV